MGSDGENGLPGLNLCLVCKKILPQVALHFLNGNKVVSLQDELPLLEEVLLHIRDLSEEGDHLLGQLTKHAQSATLRLQVAFQITQMHDLVLHIEFKLSLKEAF